MHHIKPAVKYGGDWLASNANHYRHFGRVKPKRVFSIVSSNAGKLPRRSDPFAIAGKSPTNRELFPASARKVKAARREHRQFNGIPFKFSGSFRYSTVVRGIKNVDVSATLFDWRASLNVAAASGASFSDAASDEACRWVNSHPDEALKSCWDPALHARIRWLFLQVLAATPTDPLRDTLAALLETPNLDPWLLNGVPTVIRMVPMAGSRERTRLALAAWLTRARQAPEKFGDLVAGCALGELLQTFGSFAEPSDVELLGSFVVGSWPLKPSVNAYDALARTARRHCQSDEVKTFFREQQKTLLHRGESLAEVRHLSADAGALLFSWIELLVARLGEEGQAAVDLALGGSDMLRRRTEKAIEDATAALRRRNVPAWFGPASTRAARWLEALSGQ